MTGRDNIRKQAQESNNMSGTSGFGRRRVDGNGDVHALANAGEDQIAPAVWDPSWPTHPVDPTMLPCAHTGYTSKHVNKFSRRNQSQGNFNNQRSPNNNKYKHINNSNNNTGHVSPPSMSAYGPGELLVEEYEAKQPESIPPPVFPVKLNTSETPNLPSVSSTHPKHRRTNTDHTDHPTDSESQRDGEDKNNGKRANTGNKHDRRTKTQQTSDVELQRNGGGSDESMIEGNNKEKERVSDARGGGKTMHVDVDVDVGSTSMNNMMKFSLDSPPTPSSSSFSFTFQRPDAGFLGGGSHPGFSP